MHNFGNINYFNKNNIINIKSETLYREAEDDFFYFYKIGSACKKLNLAIGLTPSHLKSIVLLADIYFIRGNIKKSLKFYLKANELSKNCPRILASIANCYLKINQLKPALDFCNLAIKYHKTQNDALYMQFLEIKLNILYELKDFAGAFSIVSLINNINNFVFVDSLSDLSYHLLSEKVKLQKKLRDSKLKIIQMK